MASLEATLALLDDSEDQDELLDLERAAHRFSISAETLRSWIRSGRLKASTAERGRFVFWRSWLHVAIDAASVPVRSQLHATATNDARDELDVLLAFAQVTNTRARVCDSPKPEGKISH